MDAKKFLELQGQIKQNNQEYLEFVNELDSWKANLEKKRDKPQPAPGKAELPPVRNSLLKKKMKKKAKNRPVAAAGGDAEEKKKIRAYDYRAWDRFDVDKACEEVDKAALSPKSESEYETDEEWEEERRKQLAEAKKQAGNEAFKAQQFDEAVELYSKAVQLNPDEAVYFCNRAMALLKLDRHAAAEADCSAALGLDSKMVKAFYRRGQARLKLGKLPEALRDLEEALAMEPGNRTLQAEVGELRLRLHPEKYATGEVKPIFDKPAAERSAKPLVRVPIQEVSVVTTAAAVLAAAAATSDGNKAVKSPSMSAGTLAPANTSAADVECSPQKPCVAAAPPAPLPSPQIAAPPETPFQYKAAHRSLARRDPLAFCSGVLCAVEPDHLPALIGESLESDTLLELVAAFSAGLAAQPELAPRVLRCLRALADRGKRFATCVAFLSAAERTRIADLVQRLRDLLGADSAAAAGVALLATAYGVGDRLTA